MVDTGYLALERVRTLATPGPVLDLGSGPGLHAAIMAGYGWKVHTLDLRPPATIVGSWPEAAPLVLDRLDVLDLPGRQVALRWLMALSADLDTILVAGTMKAPPRLPEPCRVIWLGPQEQAT